MTIPATNVAVEVASESFVPDFTNQRLLRNALGCYGTGVTIVTAATESGPAAITVNSFASVSLTPPLVLWSLDRHGSRFETFSQAEHYSIHVLNTDQQSLCMEVARDPQRLAHATLATSPYGVPVLDECAVRLDCSREAVHEAGDHLIIVGRVLLATQYDHVQPLAFCRGKTGTFAFDQSDAA